MTRFGETVEIIPLLRKYNGVRMNIEYTIVDRDTGELRCVGESTHCFLTKDGKPVSLKREYLTMDDMFRSNLPEE